MPTEPAEPRRTSSAARTVVIVVALVGGFLILGCLGCFGIGFWMYRSASTDMPEAERSVETFLDELQANRVDAAYASTTSGFRAGINQEQFRGTVTAFPGLTTHTSRSVNLLRFFKGTGGAQASFRVTLHAPSGQSSCTITVIQERGQWKVHHLSVP